MKDHFDEIQSSAYSVSLFTDWRNKLVNEVWLKNRVDAGRASAAPAEFFGAKLATRNLHPIAELSAENCTEQMGVPGPWYDRLGRLVAMTKDNLLQRWPAGGCWCGTRWKWPASPAQDLEGDRSIRTDWFLFAGAVPILR